MVRDSLLPHEFDRLVAALKSGKTWDEVRGTIPAVSPEVLDRNFRADALRHAGIEVAAPPKAEEPQRTRKSKG